MPTLLTYALLLSAALGGCGEDATGSGGPTSCVAAEDCDDGLPCTVDSCEEVLFGILRCFHDPRTTLCRPGQTCDPGLGCIPGQACETSADCASDDACRTAGRCESALRTCTFDQLDGDDDGSSPQVCGGPDCDDADPRNTGNAAEWCDGVDNDCDSRIDEGRPCPDGSTCEMGSCRCEDSGNVACPSSGCKDLMTDDEHCGACNSACGPGSTCVNALCACEIPDLVHCPGAGCVDLQTDDDDCGVCGRACMPGTVCMGGACLVEPH